MKAKRKQNASRKKTKRMAICSRTQVFLQNTLTPANFEYVRSRLKYSLTICMNSDVESIPHATY